MAEIQMPQLGETVTEGTITKWFKSIGDPVAEDEALFEVSTDKVDSEVPSPVAGTLTEIRVEEGDTVDVGTVLAVVGDGDAGGGESASADGEEAASDPAPTGGAAEDGQEAEAEAQAEVDSETEPDAPATEAPTAEPDAPATEEAPAAEPARGDSGAAGEQETVGAGKAEGPSPASGDGGLVLSPVVRRLIREHDLDATSIKGTGAGGRITRSDVMAAVEGAAVSPAPTAPASAPVDAEQAPVPSEAPKTRPPTVAAGPAVAAARPGERDTSVAFNNIRRRTGEHMVRSKATSPHVFTVMEVDLEGVEAVRRAHKARFKAELGMSLTYLPFIARALVDALDEFPRMNASVGDGELVVHNYVNLGIAVDLDHEGLIVPVIHEAQDLRLTAIARSITDLAERARTRKLSADDISGGTVTITNAGASGTLVQLPVINQPQVMILSTEGVHRRAVVVTDATGSEAIAIRSVGNLSLGWDHRAFDGAYAAAFLRTVCDILETRDWEAEL